MSFSEATLSFVSRLRLGEAYIYLLEKAIKIKVSANFAFNTFFIMPLILILEPITEGDEIMAAVDERDKILKNYMKEWDELDLDLIVTPASLMPAPLKVT